MDNILKNVKIDTGSIEIPQNTLKQWQKLLDIVVEISSSQDALINKYRPPRLEVASASSNEENMFSVDDSFKLEGLYCEEVIKSRAEFEVNNAAEIKKWQNSIYMENGLIAYLGYPLVWPDGKIFGTICIHDNKKRDFSTELKERLKVIRDSIEDNLNTIYKKEIDHSLHDYYSKLIDILPVGVMIEDKNGSILKVNEKITEITGYSKEELVGNSIFETVVEDENIKAAKNHIKRILNGDVLVHDLPSINKNGEKNYLRLQERKITLPGGDPGIVSIQSDISEKVRAQKEIKYASYHDSLTSLYNRSYLESKLQDFNSPSKLPVALIMVDLNGLKLVNDTYGHNQGDKLLKLMAEVLKKSCRDADTVARWGGDEFVILLPNTDKKIAQKVVKRINNKISDKHLELEDGNKLPLSAALGFEIKNSLYEDIFDVLDKAEEKMYKNKLTKSRSVKSNILNSLLKTLSEKSRETSRHSKRMAVLARKIAEEINLTESDINKLILTAKLHDIGKTVISDKILNKKGELTEEEWKEIEEHPAVGHRILNATEEFSHISEEVLNHHERWDGKGYPQGLKGEEIPLLARIIAIVDAYDTMTRDQVYKKAVSKKEALKEIEKNAGTQFDPELSSIFINLMENED